MKTILVPIQGYDSDRPAIEAALDVATIFGSHVTALLPAPKPFVPMMAGGVPGAMAMVMADMEAHVQSMKRSAAEAVESIASQRGVPLGAGTAHGPSLELGIEDGDETMIVLRHATANDLVVFHREEPSEGETFTTRSLVKDVLEGSGRPLLITSKRISTAFPASVAVAWSGSAEGARAVAAAMPFLAKARKVSILTAETSKTEVSQGPRLAAYLARHGIAAQARAVPRTEDSVGEALHAAALDVSADLVVMGGFTRSRLRQTFFGGVTSSMLDNYRGAIIMAH